MEYLLIEVEHVIQKNRDHVDSLGPQAVPSVNTEEKSSRNNSSGFEQSSLPASPEGSRKRKRSYGCAGCNVTGCVVCTNGPPAFFFAKGSTTPIWAWILHLTLFALSESEKERACASNETKMKKYFNLTEDIYDFILVHWDVICRKKRTLSNNWKHTVGMTLSHYAALFQNGYKIFQNTGYWALKDNVPSPYLFSPSKKSAGLTTSNNSIPSQQTNQRASNQVELYGESITYEAMKEEIGGFWAQMGELENEIAFLEDQLQVKKAEEQLLKFLQDGITSFRDRIKQRIGLLLAEAQYNYAEHQQQAGNMSNELAALREMGAQIRDQFAVQFANLVAMNKSTNLSF